MNEELCLERHKRLEEKIDIHDKRLNDHSSRLDKLEQTQSEFRVEIKNLCDNLKSLTSAIKWFMGIWVTSLLGFFFYAIQNKILK